MALNSLGLGFVFTARDLASSHIQNLERSFTSLDKRVGLGTERLQTSFQQLGVGLGVFTAGAATVGAAFSLANAAGRFEQSVAAVAAVSGATTAELRQLRDAAINAGIATQYSPTEATQGLRELAQAGFNAQESMQLLIPVLDLAAGSLGELSPQEAAGLASQAMKAFGLETDQASIAVDRMLQAVNVFALNASELPMALGIASRGAQSLHQSMAETLVTLGLVKNIIPGVERASTGVAVAMERMADPDVQKKLQRIGVSVTDSQGHFRNFLDILNDMTPALDKMTDAKRSAFLIDAFGAHALGSVQAVLTQVTNGIRTNTGETLKGGAAVAYLRDQFENAGGTAATFREKMLNTFEGQKKLLAGSLETLAIVAGEPFAQVFKPIVTVVVDVVNAILGVFRQLPGPVKKAFAGFVVAAGSIVAVVGAVIAAKAAFALLGIALQAAGVTFGGMVATMAPAIAVFGLVALAVHGLRVAFEKDVGGVATFFRDVGDRVSLVFRGLMQLWEEGAFSGSVREELNRAENGGLKDFVIRVFLWVNRLRNFFASIGAGFEAGIAVARPALEALTNAIDRVGQAMGLVAAREDAGEASSRFAAFGEAGTKVGRVLASVFELVARALAAVAEIALGVTEAWGTVTAASGFVGNAFTQLGQKLGEIVERLTGTTNATAEHGAGWVTLGNVIATIVAVVVGLVGALVAVISAGAAIASAAVEAIVDVFAGIADVITGVVFLVGGIVNGSWSDIWLGMKLVAFGVVDAIIGVVFELAGAIAGVIDAVTGFFGEGTRWQAGIRGLRDSVRAGMSEGMGVEGLTFLHDRPRALPSPVRPGPEPLATPMPAAVAIASRAPAAPLMTPAAPPPASPVVVNLQVDGATLATAVHRADRDAATRAFSPVPVY